MIPLQVFIRGHGKGNFEMDNKFSTSKPHKFGLAMAGGGVKGAVHVGVLQALEEAGVAPTLVAGTSAGALAAAFYAIGCPPKEVFDLMTAKSFFSLSSLTWSKPGLLDIEKFLDIFLPYFDNADFESLGVELNIVATDLVRGISTVFDSGPILKPLLASCAFPFVFAPVPIGDSVYSDGGTLNNFPTEIATERAHRSLGIYMSPLRQITTSDLQGTLDVIDRVYRITNRFASLGKLNDCTWTINPPEMINYGTFTLSKIEEIYRIGYRHGKALAPKIAMELERL